MKVSALDIKDIDHKKYPNLFTRFQGVNFDMHRGNQLTGSQARAKAAGRAIVMRSLAVSSKRGFLAGGGWERSEFEAARTMGAPRSPELDREWRCARLFRLLEIYVR